MNSIVNFILESGISLTLLSLVYILFLRRETFFRMNRIFLLASVVFSVLLPFIKLRIYDPKPMVLAEVTVTHYRNLMEAVTVYGRDFSGSVEKIFLSTDIFTLVYMVGVAFFLTRFLVRLLQIGILIRKNKVKIINGIKFVKLQREFNPFSFIGYVFVGTSDEGREGFDKILAHESEHIRQGHSADVILLEILTVFQWFNPAIWMLRRAIRENHEFLADEAVLNSGISSGQYKNLLICQFAGLQYDMASNFSSLARSRINMMSKIKSSKISAGKVLIGIIISAGLVIAFACEQKKSAEFIPSVSSKEMKIMMNGDSLRIEGSSEDLKKVSELLSSGKFKVLSDNLTSGFLTLTEKTEDQGSLPESDKIFFMVETMPEFPGGELALRKFIAGNVNYPENAKKNGIQGKVYVSFVVSKDGSVRGAKIIRGVEPELDKEALRVVNQLPVWKSGLQKGEPVNVSYTIPISFVLQ